MLGGDGGLDHAAEGEQGCFAVVGAEELEAGGQPLLEQEELLSVAMPYARREICTPPFTVLVSIVSPPVPS